MTLVYICHTRSPGSEIEIQQGKEDVLAVIEFVTVANHAEAINGLLYLSGAGWTDSWRTPNPEDGSIPPTQLGVGVSILVPWVETNRRHDLSLRLEHEDGGPPLLEMQGQFEVGRPAGITPGVDLRSVLAVNANIVFERPGGYRFVATVGDGSADGEMRAVSLRVHDQRPPHIQGPL